MRIKIQIETAAYDEPYVTNAIYRDDDSMLKLTWNQVADGEKRPTEYVVTVNKCSGEATVKRTGEICSTLVFNTAHETAGTFITPYGNIVMKIKTEYINLPSILSPMLQIKYKMEDCGGELTENIFSVKLLLQK